MMRDEIWLHVGSRPPNYFDVIAARVPGVVMQWPTISRGAKAFMADHPERALLQDAGAPKVESIFGPDNDWLLEQAKQPLVSAPLATVLRPDKDGGEESLRAAVAAAQRFANAATSALPAGRVATAMWGVDYRWLTSKKARLRLISAISGTGIAVAIMLWKDGDPLETPAAIEGLLEVIRETSDLRVLRCDHGAIGAYAFGAVGGSIGLGTGARHYVPVGESSWADNDDPTPRVFLPSLHAWWKGSLLAPFDNDPLFACSCRVCAGASLARFQNEALKDEADAHSVAAWTEMASGLARAEQSVRSQSWIAMCEAAYGMYDEIEDRRGLPQAPSKQLKAWLEVAGVPAV